MQTLVAEWAHASHTCSPPQAHSRTLPAGQEHSGDRAVFGFLRRGGAARAAAVSGAAHAGTTDALLWTQDAAHRRAETTAEGSVIRAARRHAGRVGRADGPLLSYLHHGSLAGAARLEVLKK